MNYRSSIPTIILLTLAAFVLTQNTCKEPKKGRVPERALVMFYNVENLFDTLNDPITNDNQFLPGTDKDWTSERYYKKLNDLATVISKADNSALPDIIGLCEVENSEVVQDLMNTGDLKKGDYGIIHRNSPDARGIDVAVVYNKNVFELTSSSFYTVVLNDTVRPQTRQVLYFTGLLHDEPMHFFVAHWPSRHGGAHASEHKRVQVAALIRSKVDSIKASDKKAAIIIMGDLNDHPNDRSVYEVLGAKEDATKGDLVDLFFDDHLSGKGTYNYRGDWGVLDHFIVSSNLLDASLKVQTSDASAHILKYDWLLYHDEDFDDTKPSRTYGGPNYYGGYSDHLPILLELEIK